MAMIDPTLFFKCLADETRLRTILLILHETELCVCELTEALDESQPKVSRHLAQLKNLSVLEARRQSQWVYYRLNPELPQWALSVLEITLKEQKASIQPYLDNLQAMGDRPERQEVCCP